MARTEFEDVIPGVGFLTDRNILAALKEGFLIESGTWAEAQIRHASYTIRLGHRVEIERSRSGAGPRERASVSLIKTGAVELRPGDTALLYSLENLRLPNCVLGLTVARGLLFAESLVPENTYVDPGFVGSIYTTVTNVSGRVLKIPYETPIARLFFYRLAENVGSPYKSGPAIGIDQHLESSPGIAFPTQGAARSAPYTALLSDLETSERGGFRSAEIFRRQAVLGRAALLTAVIWPPFLQAALSWSWVRDNAGPFVGSVIASVIAAPIIYWCQRVWTRISERE